MFHIERKAPDGPDPERWFSSVCKSELSVQEAHAAFLESDKQTPYSDRALAHRGYLGTAKGHLHQSCFMQVHKDREKVNITLLRICRQMYGEVNQVLWSHAIFSFDDSDVLRHFVKRRTAVQIRMMRRVRLVVSRPDTRPGSCVSTLGKMLPALQALHLEIDDAFPEGCERRRLELQRLFNGLKYQLREGLTAPFTLRDVTVVVMDSGHYAYKDMTTGFIMRRLGIYWPLQERIEFAKDLAEHLLQASEV